MAKIEERIVEMRFDNQQFEQGAQQSIKTLERLDKSVNDLGKNQSGLTAMIETVRTVSDQFSVLEEVARGALMNIGSRAIQAGEQFIKSMTVDQVTAGFQKYEEETKAVQTIMNATGESIENVYGELEKLMWFTDETSYNFTDMTNNIGKFTAQGIKLEDARVAMQGIATWAAKSGQGVNEASRAMYNLSQSLGMGSVRLQDWMSIEGANMATAEFRQIAIDTAIELGELSEAAEYAKGKMVTVNNFRETLQKGWFTSDVLIEALRKYGEYADLVREKTEETGMTAAEAMEELAGTYEGVGESAFKAGQEAKTFTDVVDATADAVSTGWLKTFRLIVGNYEEAKLIWTELANGLVEFFSGGAGDRNAFLKEWAEMGGRVDLMQGIANVLIHIADAVQLVKDAWHDIFPPMDAEGLFSVTQKFRELTEMFTLTDEASQNIRDALGGLFSILRAIGGTIGAVFGGLTPSLEQMNLLAGTVVENAGALGRYIASLVDAYLESDALASASNFLGAALDLVGTGLNNVVGFLSQLGSMAFGGLTSVFESLGNFFSQMKASISGLNIPDKLVTFFSSIGQFLSDGGIVKIVAGFFDVLAEAISGAGQSVNAFADAFGNFSGGAFLINLIALVKTVTSFIKDIPTSFDESIGIVDTFKKMMGDISDTLKNYQEQIKIGQLLKIAAAVTALAVSMKLIASIDPASMLAATGALVGLMKMLEVTMTNLQPIANTEAPLLAFSAAIFVLAKALKTIGDLEMESILSGLIGIGAAMLELVGAMKLLSGAAIDKTIGPTLLMIATSIGLLTVPLLAMAALPLDRLVQSVAALGVVLLELAAALNLMKSVAPQIMAVGAALVLVSTAMIGFTTAVAALGLLPLENLIQGVSALGVTLLALTGVMALMSQLNPLNLLGAATALNLTSTAMILLLAPITALSLIPWQNLLISLGAVAASLLMLVGSLAALSLVSPVATVGAIALNLLAAAILLLTPSLAALAAIPFQNLAGALVGLAGALTILIVAGGAAAAVAPGLLALSAALLAFGVAVAAPVAALAMLTTAIATLILAIGTLAKATDEEMAQAAENMKLIVLTIIETIGNAAGEILLLVAYILEGIVKALAETLPDIITMVVEALVQLMELIAEEAPTLVNTVLDILQVLVDNVPRFLDILQELVDALIEGLTEIVFDGLGTLVESIIRELPKFVSRIATALKNALFGAGEEVGAEVGEGVSKGMKSSEKSVERSGRSLGKTATDAVKDGAQTHSASEATTEAGEDIDRGLINGMKNLKDKVGETAKGMGLFTLTSLQSGLDSRGGADSLASKMLSQMNQSLKNGDEELSATTGSLGSNAADAFEKKVKESNAGEKAAGHISKKLKEDKSIEKAAKEQAEKVANAFENELSKIDLSMSRIGSKYDIAEALLGPEDTKEKTQKLTELEMAQMREELMSLANKVHIENDKFRDMLANQEKLKYSQKDIESAYTDFITAQADLTKKAAEIAEWQYKQVGTQKEAEAEVQKRIQELASMRAELMKDDMEKHQKRIEEANAAYLQATTDTQKDYYAQVVRDLEAMTPEEIYGPMLAQTPDVSQIRAEVYKALGVNPNNPQESWMSVEEIVKSAVAATQSAYQYAVEQTYEDLIGSYETVIGSTAEEMVNLVDEQKPAFNKAGQAIVESVGEGVTDSKDDLVRDTVIMTQLAEFEVESVAPEAWPDVGIAMMDGLIEGIGQRRSGVIEAAVEVANAASVAARNSLKISSPSKVFAEIGRYMVEGMAEGLYANTFEATDASENAVQATLNPFKDLANRVSDILSYEMDPTIRPVIDMEGVETGVREIDRLMSSTGRSFVSRISSVEQAKEYRNLMKSIPQKPQTSVVNNFTQNNYSPKALSDADIYRQTRNELRWALRRSPT